MPSVKVGDISMYYELKGDGAPLVLINGLSTDVSEIEPVFRPLAIGHRLLAFDNRGAGRTDKPNSPYTIKQMAEDTAGLMRQLGITAADIVGISMGSRIALELALTQPKMVKRIILISGAARPAPPTFIRWLALKLIPRLPLPKGKYPQPYYSFVRQREASSSYDCLSKLHQISAPTLILHGRSDKIAPMLLANELHDGIKHSKLTTFKGGHLFFLWGGRESALRAIENFLTAGLNNIP